MTITLATLEQEAARRVGPYYAHFTDRQVPNTANFTFANFPNLRTEIDLDSVTNLWLLRRAQGLDVVDRQRLVSSYDTEMGRVYPDRPWGAIPEPGEVVEFHHLDPLQQLRVSVLAGLRRCFLRETVQAYPTAPWGGIDLTAQFAWLADPWQIARVRYGWPSPYGEAPWGTYTTQSHLILTGTHGTALAMPVWIDTWRPAWTWVNGADSTTGPVADEDSLEVDLDYAAAAAHIEAWHHFPARVQAAAAGNLQATREQAAQEFSRLALVYGPSRPTSIGFETIIRIGAGNGGWLNGPW